MRLETGAGTGDMDRVRATNHPLSLAHDEEMRARHGSALDGGNALRRSRSRSGFGSRDSGEGFGSFDERGGGLLVSAGKPRRSARTRLNRVRSRLSGAAAARVKRFKKLPSAAKAVRVIAALLAFAGASDVLMRVGGLARGDAGTPPTPPTPYRPSALAATQAGLYARRRSPTRETVARATTTRSLPTATDLGRRRSSPG